MTTTTSTEARDALRERDYWIGHYENVLRTQTKLTDPGVIAAANFGLRAARRGWREAFDAAVAEAEAEARAKVEADSAFMRGRA